jgi:glycosyltransferase involved in cell wall biosynthesis
VAFFGKLHGAALAAVYHACDVFCLPCHRSTKGGFEGLPSVLIEAMAYGRPIITTRHTEIPRVLRQILVPENDVPALAEALERVYHSESLRQELGAENRALAELHFSNCNLERKLSLFSQIASPAGAAKRQDGQAVDQTDQESNLHHDETTTSRLAEASLECSLK